MFSGFDHAASLGTLNSPIAAFFDCTQLLLISILSAIFASSKTFSITTSSLKTIRLSVLIEKITSTEFVVSGAFLSHMAEGELLIINDLP